MLESFSSDIIGIIGGITCTNGDKMYLSRLKITNFRNYRFSTFDFKNGVNTIIGENDSVKFNLESGEIDSFLKFEQGATVTISGGKNIGRVGTISHVSKHDAGFDIVHVRDARNKTFATRTNNVFVIG